MSEDTRSYAWQRLEMIRDCALGLGWEHQDGTLWQLPGTPWQMRLTLQACLIFRRHPRGAATTQRRYHPTQLRAIRAHLTTIHEAVASSHKEEA